MDFLEIERFIDAYKERQLMNRRENAANIYSLARLVGVSVGTYISSSVHYPSISEAYPSLFDFRKEQEIEQKQILQRSVMNFINFANAHNQKIDKEKQENEING